jgi:hypothetical protein
MKTRGLPRGRVLRNKVRSRATTGETQWRLEGVQGRQQGRRALHACPRRQLRRPKAGQQQDTAGLRGCLQEGPLLRLCEAARRAALRAGQAQV